MGRLWGALAAFGAVVVCMLSPVPGASASYQVSAWTYGDRTSLLYASSIGGVDEVNVDWYLSNQNGSIGTDSEDLDFIALARAHRLRVLATLTNYSARIDDFDPKIPKAILANKRARSNHISKIVRLCVRKGYDGIDLDWESLRVADRDRFSAFVKQLACSLHNHGKLLSIAVHAKTSEPGDWSGAKAQNWSRIGAAVDEFKIMTYDYSGSWSGPGPIGPPAWADEVLAFAETCVPTGKIMLGIPFYGYDWSAAGVASLSYGQVAAIIGEYHPTVEREPGSHEAFFTYRDSAGVDHTVYFQDRAAIAAKLQVLRAHHPGVSGIAIWNMGDEDMEFWDEIASQLK